MPSFPYRGPDSRGRGGQPPPPAGPAPPLPTAVGPEQPAAFANYGYSPAAPVNQSAAPRPGNAQQPYWNQQQQQWQQQYPQQQSLPAAAPALGQYPAAQSPSQTQYSQQPMQQGSYRPPPQQQQQYPYQTQAPVHSQTPPQQYQPAAAAPGYGYTPAVPQYPNPAPSNAQNWPGAYATGDQVGSASKRPRFQASSPPNRPRPVSPYVPHNVAPNTPLGGSSAAQYVGASPVALPPQQVHAWQGSNAHMAHAMPQTGPQSSLRRPPSGHAVQTNAPGRGGLPPNPSRNGRAGRGAVSKVAPANTTGRGMNRDGANRDNMAAGSAQRAGLPANPSSAVNASRAQSGARAWGSNAATGSQVDRRASLSGSVSSDKVKASDVAKTGLSSQNSIPLRAPSGPSGARKAGTNADAFKAGPAVSSSAASKNSASSKRANTEFRIKGFEIPELEYSWFGSRADSKSPTRADDGKTEVPVPEEADDSDETPTVPDAHDENMENMKAPADASAYGGVDAAAVDASAAQSKDDADGSEDEGAEAAGKQDHDQEPVGKDEHDEDANADGDADAEAEGDAAMSQPAAAEDVAEAALKASGAPSKESKDDTGKVAGKRSKDTASRRELSKLSFSFAAQSNAGPEGAPTGPKADLVPVSAKDDVEVPHESVAETPAQEPANEGGGDRDQQDSDVKEPKDAEAESSDKIASTEPTASAVQQPDAQAQTEPEKVEEANGAAVDEETPFDGNAAAASSKVSASKGPPQLPLNRIFLSFAGNRKRLAINAEAVKSVRIHRSEHWVEIVIRASGQNEAMLKKGQDFLVCNGTLLEKRSKGQENLTAVTRFEIAEAWEKNAEPNDDADDDHLELPPFHRLTEGAELTLLVHLDPSAPLPEPAWLRKNDVHELLSSLQRSSTAIAGQSETAVAVGTAQHVWFGKIQVMDPDPPPSMRTVLFDWVKASSIGALNARRKWVNDLLARGKSEKNSEGDDAVVARAFIEIVLRLIKGEPVSLSSGHFSRALTSASFTASTTYPGYVMLSLLDLALDNPAADATEVSKQVDAMLMEIEPAVLSKAIDLTWRDVSGAPANPVAGAVAAGGRKQNLPKSRQQQGGGGRQNRGYGGAQGRGQKRKRV